MSAGSQAADWKPAFDAALAAAAACTGRTVRQLMSKRPDAPPARIAAMLALYEAGMGIGDIALFFGMHEASVSGALGRARKRAGAAAFAAIVMTAANAARPLMPPPRPRRAPHHHRRWTEAEDETIRRLGAEGVSPAEIAKLLPVRTEKAIAFRVFKLLGPVGSGKRPRRPSRRPGAWSRDENEVVEKALAAGHSAKEIAPTLPGRSLAAVAEKLTRTGRLVSVAARLDPVEAHFNRPWTEREDEINDVAAAINTAIQAVVSELPVTSAVAAAVVTLTARHGGAATDLDVRLSYHAGEALPPGVAITIAETTAGATDPDIDAAFDALPDEKYDMIVLPYSGAASMVKLETELAARWDPTQQLDGLGFAGFRGTAAAATTYGNARNSRYSSVMPIRSSPMPTYEWAAGVVGAAALSAANDPALPFQTLALRGLLPAALEERFDFTERNTLLSDGMSTHAVDPAGQVRIERLVTTYQTMNGVADDAWMDVNTPLTLSFLRSNFRARMQTKYGRFKLADDGTRFRPGQKIITPKTGRAEAVAWYRDMEDRGLVEGGEAFKEGLVVERNDSDSNRLDFLLPPDIVNQLRVMGVQMSFIL